MQSSGKFQIAGTAHADGWPRPQIPFSSRLGL